IFPVSLGSGSVQPQFRPPSRLLADDPLAPRACKTRGPSSDPLARPNGQIQELSLLGTQLRHLHLRLSLSRTHSPGLLEDSLAIASVPSRYRDLRPLKRIMPQT